MSNNFMFQNTLMNQLYYNNGMNYSHFNYNYNYINQNNQQYLFNQINLPFNCYQNYQKMQYNNYLSDYPNTQSVLRHKRKNKFSKFYQNNSENNEAFIKMQFLLQEKAIRNNYVFNLCLNNSLKPKKNEKILCGENSEKISTDIDSSNSSLNNDENNNINNNINELNLNKEKELNKKNIILEKKEDEDYDLINEYSIPNNRRFSQRSKRSNNSDNSNMSNSTQDSLNEAQFSTMKKDVSFYDKKKEKNLIKNEEIIVTHKTNPAFENTVILNVKVKISKDNIAIFKLKRFDDVFTTIQYFCEINNLDEKFIKPLIIKSLCAINTLYQLMNCNINKDNLELLQTIKNKK